MAHDREGMAVVGRRFSRRALLAGVPGLLLIAAAGCGEDEDDPATQPPATATTGATPAAETTATTPAATATTASESTAASSGSEMSFPVTVEHKFGATEIPAAPQRVVSLVSAA